jgi:succinate dehydrogenase / fumarate reductase cytochrome b subunit
MNWFFNFFTSSIGKKWIMSLTGLFLILFLLVHLSGNFQLMIDDEGEQFNKYAKFMTTNPVIKIISWGNYLFIILHAIQGMMLWSKNRNAKGSNYLVASRTTSSFASRNMGPLGVIILIFILIHLWQFWFQMKVGALDMVTYEDYEPMKNLYTPVALAFSQWWYVLFYVICMGIIALHLWHGFQSAFQTLGINHKKYTPLIKFLGKAYSAVVPIGYALIPVWFYLFRQL